MRNKHKTHCKRGHAFDAKNTAFGNGGKERICKTCRRSYMLARYHKQAWKERDKLRKYGLTKEQLDAMRAVQENLCFLCGKGKTLCVDHEHATGKIRKLLCHNCNLGIGNFYENPAVLRKAAEYLETF